MSGIAAVAMGGTGIRSVPRSSHRETITRQPWAPEWDQPAQDPTDIAQPEGSTSSPRALSPTEELRRRIVEATIEPEPRGRPRTLLLGLAAAVVLATAGVMFPGAIAALLPGVAISL